MEMSEERATPLDYVLIGDPEDEAYLACQEIMLRHDGKTALDLYTSAATIFQTFYRGFQARQELRRRQVQRAVENAAASVIQRRFLAHLDRKNYLVLQRRHRASLTITRTLRKVADVKKNKAATVVQAAFKGYQVRTRMSVEIESARELAQHKVAREREKRRIETYKGTPQYAEEVALANRRKVQAARSRAARKAQALKKKQDADRRAREEALRKQLAERAIQQRAGVKLRTRQRIREEAQERIREQNEAALKQSKYERRVLRAKVTDARHTEHTE